jgi:hypothetical protein
MRCARTIVSAIVPFLFGGCDKHPSASPQAGAQASIARPLSAPPEVTSEAEEGFHDLVFYIHGHRRLPDGSQSLLGSGVHKGRAVGLEVILGAAWRGASLDPGIPVVAYQGDVTYRSTGADSDAFVQVLDELYGSKVGPKAMAREVRFSAISLEGDPRDLAKGPVKIKLFFESDKEDDYAELFTNVELGARRLEVREKDQEYRRPLVRALEAR